MMNARTGYWLAAVAVLAIAIGAVLVLRRTARPPVAPPTVAHTAPLVTPAPADCLLPGPAPVPPDGNTATAADMKLGHDVIQAFVVQLEAYQACRLRQADQAAPAITPQQKQQWVDQGNSAVDDANALASAFATQLKAYKARPAAPAKPAALPPSP